MNQDQTTLLLAKAAAAYPNNAPNFKKNPQIFKVWVEMLWDYDAEAALRNLHSHIATSSFFPTIAEIAKPAEQTPDIVLLQLQTAERFAEMDEWEQKAVPPPKELLGRKRGEKE